MVFLNKFSKLENLGSFIPNYAAAISISSGYIATTDGWIRVASAGSKRNITVVNVNGVQACSFAVSDGYMPTSTMMIPIGIGQVVTASGQGSLYFIPIK